MTSQNKSAKGLRRRSWEAVLSVVFVRLVRIGEQFILIPVFLSVWGVDVYGEWLTLTAIATFVSMATVGPGQAGWNEIIMQIGAGDRRAAERAFASIEIVLLVIGAAALAIVFVICSSIDIGNRLGLAHISPIDAKVIVIAVTVQITLFFLLGPVGAVIAGTAGVGVNNLIVAGGKCCEILAIGILVFFGAGPRVAALAALAVAVATIGAQVIAVRFTAPWFRPSLHSIHLPSLRTLIGPSVGNLTLFVSTNILGIQLPRLILFGFAGPAAVTVFSITSTYARSLRILANVILLAMQVELARSFGEKNIDRFLMLVKRICNLSVWTALAIGFVLLVAAPLLIPLWTSGKVAADWALLVPLIIGAAFGALSDPLIVALTSINRIERVAIAHIVGLCCALALCAPFVPSIGAVAVAMALIVPDITTIIIARSDLARRINKEGSLPFAALIQWPGDFIRAEMLRLLRVTSLGRWGR